MTILPEDRIAERLMQVPGWSRDHDHIVRKFEFEDFLRALSFVNRVGEIAEGMNHHPDIHLENYRWVTLRVTTHDSGGLTERDFALAQKIDALPLS